MQNFLQPGQVLDLTMPYDRTAGQGVKVGAFFGVLKSDALSGATGEVLTEGVYTLAATSAQTWAQGDEIYWDDTNKRCDNVATVGMRIGVARDAKANPGATGVVKLTPVGKAVATQANIAQVATANATDLATSEALANQLKTTVNAILTALAAAGVTL